MLIMIVTQIYCDNKDKMNAKFHGRNLEYSIFNLIRIKYLILASTRKYYM